MGAVQQIINVVDFGLDMAHAIDAERIDAVTWSRGENRLGVEVLHRDDPRPALGLARRRIPESVLEELESRGHVIVRVDDEYRFAPLMQTVGVNLRRGRNEAISDPRPPNGLSESGAAGQ